MNDQPQYTCSCDEHYIDLEDAYAGACEHIRRLEAENKALEEKRERQVHALEIECKFLLRLIAEAKVRLTEIRDDYEQHILGLQRIIDSLERQLADTQHAVRQQLTASS